MKSEASIRHKLKQVRYRRLQKRFRKELKRRPCNCAFNREKEIPGSLEKIRVCGYGEELEDWSHTLCDERFGGLKQARSCPVFKHVLTKGEIREEFEELLQGDPGELAFEYPDIAALQWVLQGPLEPVDSLEEPFEEELLEEEQCEEVSASEEPPDMIDSFQARIRRWWERWFRGW